MDVDDAGPFTMRLLHFRRTFVEKMFAIHAKVEIFKRDGRPIGTYARHYYDLYRLALQPEVQAMLTSPEYKAIKEDYDRISRVHFERDYFHPEKMSFANSDALFPPAAIAEALERDYEQQCRVLCFGAFPTWPEVRAYFEVLRVDL
jgi:hypothetical protein